MMTLGAAIGLITCGMILFWMRRVYRHASWFKPSHIAGLEPNFLQTNWYEIAGLMETNYWRIVRQHKKLVRHVPNWLLRTNTSGNWAFCHWNAAEFLDLLDRYPASEREQALQFLAAVMRAEGYRL